MRGGVISLFMSSAAVFAFSACQTTAGSEAVLSESSPQTTAALSQAVSKALGGREVTLAPNVLMESSKLVMDPKYVGDRSRERPDHFTLMKDSSGCYLIHEESGTKTPLGTLNCQAL